MTTLSIFFLVVTIFTSTLFSGFSTNLPHVAPFLNLAFCFLILLPSFSSFFFAILYYAQFMVLKMVLVWIPIFYEFHFVVTLNVNKVLSFDSRGSIFFLLHKLGISFLLLLREKLLSSMVWNWYWNKISFFLILFFYPLKNKHYTNQALHQDN